MKILFMSRILSDGLTSHAARTGIFFVAFNVLKQFSTRPDMEIYILSVDEKKYLLLEKFVEQEFPDGNVKIIKGWHDDCFSRIYLKFKNKRIFHKGNKNPFRKLFWSVAGILVKPGYMLTTHFYVKKTFVKNAPGFDCFFSPYHAAPEYCAGLKKFMILHDVTPLLFPEYFNKTSVFRKIVKNIRHDDFYFSVSNSCRSDFIRLFPVIDPEKITVTPLACNERFVPADENAIACAREKYHIPAGKKYVFSLCTLEPRKNLIRAVRTFIEFIKKNNIDDLVFVLGGGHWEEFIGKLKAEITNLGDYRDKIIRAGYIDDEDVPRLYSGAAWFVYTSQYEGFGLPPLEAMSCGCPVITSNNSSLPEVVGDAGIMIDFDSDHQHIKAYEDYYFNPALRAEYAARGLAHAKNFSWEKCAGMMIDEMKRNLQK